jgi:hypothetical protein
MARPLPIRTGLMVVTAATPTMRIEMRVMMVPVVMVTGGALAGTSIGVHGLLGPRYDILEVVAQRTLELALALTVAGEAEVEASLGICPEVLGVLEQEEQEELWWNGNGGTPQASGGMAWAGWPVERAVRGLSTTVPQAYGSVHSPSRDMRCLFRTLRIVFEILQG